ncbi:hypothetical protein KQ51_01353 [Candidatus Izimaplasma bacterium HR1]|jgi:hypothetical protein|uniref:hypothetical protein n=1 Tax=Candidatus Izimoplasma sp. HR1 TaxID=1541959 RepID=UPI0004F7F2B6|nr:hypothetical protein KQ51_01353 [Candidatus Izimaplasma bacterium HR1]
MNYLWGSLMLLIGVLMFLGAMMKSEFILYRLIHARAEKMWGDNAHTFLMISGLIVAGLSSMFFLNVWG